MTLHFGDYQFEQQTKAVRFHEAGHAAIAQAIATSIKVNASLTGSGEGEAYIDFGTEGSDSKKYCVAVAGCMAEAKQCADLDIDTDSGKLNVFASSIVSLLNAGKTEFEVPVPMAGNSVKSAACNASDFSWLGTGKPDPVEVTKAAISVSQLLNQSKVWDEVIVIADILLKHGKYDSSLHGPETQQ